MLSTGVRTAVGIQVLGPDIAVVESISTQLERLLQGTPGARRVYAERVATSRYIEINIDRQRAARFGLNIADVHGLIDMAVGGAAISEAIEGRERYPITVRYPDEWRDSIDRLRTLPLPTSAGSSSRSMTLPPLELRMVRE